MGYKTAADRIKDAQLDPVIIQKALEVAETFKLQPTVQPTVNKDVSNGILCPITDMLEEKASFLFYPYIVRGKINIFAGDPDAGKTSLAIAIAAKVTKGEPILSSECEIEPSNVLIICTEDDNSFLAGRFRESGGDKSRCFMLSDKQLESIDSFDSEIIEKYISANHIRYVVFDPMQRFIGEKTDMYRSNQTHPILSRLAAMASRHDCAIVIISHMSKGVQGAQLIHRILGSIDLLGASRSTIACVKDPDDDTRSIVLHIKSNCAPKGKSIVYHMSGDFGGVLFDGYSALTAKDIERSSSKLQNSLKVEESPIFVAIEKLFAENSSGLFVTYDQLDNYAIKLFGESPCPNGARWSSRVKAIQRDLMNKAKILVTHGKRKTENHIELGETIMATGEQRAGITIAKYAVTPAMITDNISDNR